MPQPVHMPLCLILNLAADKLVHLVALALVVAQAMTYCALL